ncbi:MAG: restriction endonuclease subunit S [Parvibaculaceae bacterium]
MAGKTKRKSERELKPKLRFPEFDSAWTEEPLSESAKIINEKAGEKKCVFLSITSGVGLVSQQEKFGRTIAGKSYKNYYVIRRNDFAYNKSATKEFPQGYIAMYSGDERASVPNSIFTCFRVDEDELVPEYVDYLFHSNHHGRWLQNFITVGARAHGSLSVNDDDLLAMPVPRPTGKTSLAEQRKIAGCLSSLDELIGAESRKLEALQAHKKGLMQQLFPREGETLPRLRFPEFKDAGEWEERTLGELVEIRSGQSPSQYQLDSAGKYPFVKVEDLNNCTKYQSVARQYSADTNGLVPTGSIIFPKRGAAIELNKLRLSEREILMDTNMMALTPISTCHAEFLFYAICQIGLSSIADSSTIPQINNKHIIPFRVLVPTQPEQERIAACLTSHEFVVVAQSQKLDALKTRKKGLMQQLFPSMEDAHA